MDNRRKETFMVRLVSVGFSILALAIFRPLGLDLLGWMMPMHLIAILVLGTGICYVTETILTYPFNMPSSLEKGVGYIIHRNLWFQIINTPLMALMVCTYLHFVISGTGEDEPLSWKGYLQTLLVLAFCSFAIGLYWRYKFRSRYLAVELEETKNLNEQLLKSQTLEDVVQPSSAITLTGTTNESVTLQIDQLMYIEAVGNYVKVYQFRNGEVHADMLRATSKQMENDLRSYPMIVRCHRAFLVNLGQVDHLVSHSGSMQLFMKHSNETLPVSRSNMAGVKEAINGMTSI